jgi:ATP-dependent DNA helicase DinG
VKPSDAIFSTRSGEPPWPDWVTSFRDHQIPAIEHILDAYSRGVDVVFLDAPTGSGKSLVGEAVRRAMGVRGVYMCSGKDLQDQYLRDFPYAKTLKGRANYPTERFPAYTCDDCTGKTCGWCDSKGSCPYMVAKRSAGSAPVGVLNTAYFLAETQSEFSLFKGRKLVVADESDTLEAMLMNHVEFRVKDKMLAQLGIDGVVKAARVATVRKWLVGELIPAINDRRQQLNAQGNLFGGLDEVKVVRERNQLARLAEGALRVARGLTSDDGEDWGEWVRDYDDRYPRDVILKPVTVNEVGAEALWPKGEKWLCMSGSIISADEQAESLGVEAAGKTWELVNVDMTFPKENRPIKYRGVANLTYKTMDEERPKLVKGVLRVLGDHPDDNVLVHTVNYRLAEDLTEAVEGTPELGDRRAWSYANAASRAWTLEQFKAKGGVMFAPSMDRGIDLPEDLCRVVVVAKIPFPSLKDRQIEARMRRPGGQLWYGVQVARTLLQMTGRGVRSENDYAITYILDRQFGGFWSGVGKRYLPGWWKEAMT